MTTSAIMSALRVAGRQHITASTLGARAQATGSHLFRMPRFTQVREKVGHGAAVMSSPFSVGGHDWRIKCYPNGGDEQAEGCISLYLRHDSHARTGDAMASFNLSILDKASKPSHTSAQIERHRFTGGYWGWRKFIKLQDLDADKNLLHDDCLSVICDVTVDLELHSDEYTDEATAAHDLPKAPPLFDQHGLAEAIWNRQVSDVKIVVGGDGDEHTFAAHRWVLEARSPVFKADLALASSNASTLAELRIDDMQADVCKALLQFIYTDSPPPQLAAMAERLLVAADRYQLRQLKHICEEALCKDTDRAAAAAELAKAPPPFALHGLAEAIWNAQEVDVKIVIGGDGHTTFAAHRSVLEARSPIFKANLAALTSSNAELRLRVDDMDADVCKALLQFIYTDSPPLQLATMAERLLVAADRYELEQLKLSCEEALCKDIDTRTVADALVLAERHGGAVLREACMQFLASPDNLNAVLASSDGLEKLKTGCPSALLELLMKKITTTPQEES